MIFEREDIMGKSMVLQIAPLSYCDLRPRLNLPMKLGMQVNNFMIQRPSKFDNMSMKTSRVRNDF